MITRFRVQNYKALRDVTLHLTPIHVLIGPNDTGKTSILEAIAALCRSVEMPLSSAFTGAWEGRSLVWYGDDSHDDTVYFDVEWTCDEQSFGYQLDCKFPPQSRKVLTAKEFLPSVTREGIATASGAPGVSKSLVAICASDEVEYTNSGFLKTSAQKVLEALRGVQVCRWDPRILALPAAPDADRRFRVDPSGFGLALCLDDILGYDRDRFTSLESRFREIFPQIKSIKLIPGKAFKSPIENAEQVPFLNKADGKGLYFEFIGSGELVSAAQVSDGVLLVLAYLTLLYLPKPPRVLLVEEPENGIHPKRLQDVLKILRELVAEQSHTQVILTTHSPYVVDLFEPNEVTLCEKNADGSVSVQRLSESETVRQQINVFTLGEIWTAEGDEALGRTVAGDEVGQK